MAKLKIKSRKERISEYQEKYSDIPHKFEDLIKYLKEKYKVSDKDIEKYKQDALMELELHKIFISMYEIPIPYMRGRIGFGKSIYTPLAKENSEYMSTNVIKTIKEFKKIYTPMEVKGVFYLPTPNYFNKKEKILAELGIIRPITVPDVDNLVKGYLDASNNNVFYDDALIVKLEASKYYSVKPRVELTIGFFNKYISDKQLKKILESKKFLESLPENLILEVSEQLINGEYYKGEGK